VEIRRDILWRVYLSFIGIVLLSFVVLGRAFYIQKAQGKFWRSMSDSLHQKFIEMDAERGTIYSEDGQMLSTSIPYFDIYFDFGAEGLRDKNGQRFRDNIDSFSISMANYFRDKSAAEYKSAIRRAYSEKNRYYPLRKNLSFADYKAFRNFPLVRLGRNKSGVIVETNTKRLNPFGLLARRTIGLARENAQNVGLERTYDSLLKGNTGKRLVRFISGSAYVPVEGYEIDPENGKDIITTLDVNIQDIAENALYKMLAETGSEHGTCILMETSTGKIRAIANLGLGKKGNYDEDLNYALRTTEPGSTIKLATLLAVLESGSSKITDMVEVGSTGTAFVGVRDVTDAERAPKPWLTVKECFAHSSNVGISKIAYKAFAENPSQFKNYLHRFHLDKKTGIGLVGEESPVLPQWKKNKEGLHAMLTMSFGYAIEVSPIHTLMLYNAVANNGKMMKPYLVNSINNGAVMVKEFSPEVLNESICRHDVIMAARQCMEAVVTEGTAKEVFKDLAFPVAGKTGTAHVAGGKINYADGVYQASFVGYFPADKPEFSCIVVIRTQPHAPLHFGGQLAAPVFKEVANKVYAMYVRSKQNNSIRYTVDSSYNNYAGYAPEIKTLLSKLDMKYKDSVKGDWTSVNANGNALVLGTNTVTSKIVPDVKNMNLRDALYVLENLGIKVKYKGRGKVLMQDIVPGRMVTKNQAITLLLNE
jgi:cell division protein FtsI (penicillin-binding protein 3)